MADKAFSSELERVESRADANELQRHIKDYYDDYLAGVGKWGEDKEVSFNSIMDAQLDDPEKSLAYAVVAMANFDDPGFLYYVAAGPLENSLCCPSDDLVERVLCEARRTPRFRWMLNGVYSHAIARNVAARIENELGGWKDEYPMPPRPLA